MLYSVRHTCYMAVFALCAVFVVQTRAHADGVSPSQGMGEMFNKSIAAMADLSFRPDKAYSLLVPNSIYAALSGPQSQPGSRQHDRSLYQSKAMQI